MSALPFVTRRLRLNKGKQTASVAGTGPAEQMGRRAPRERGRVRSGVAQRHGSF